MSNVDLLVAGAGPAGLSAAITAARAGLAVTIVDPNEGRTDNACGEGLLPGALRELDRLGVTVSCGAPFVGVRYCDARDDALSASGNFPGPGALGLRRNVLQMALVDQARSLGVRMSRGRVSRVLPRGVGVCADEHRAGWLIAAGGLPS